jgi:hypothetical protein
MSSPCIFCGEEIEVCEKKNDSCCAECWHDLKEEKENDR